ncbi:porphobilinogen synthase [Helicobacter sp. MIT 14-3879]|uniref:porphobilinogen synthase n=1 Tax=Helicobacter sp. MIT 14-3879 TaxID=2040649 RepID=UPI000E1ED8BB|nr:porphobilinogen synthase [Helicobacter sp. MIT 14-3879]RDU63978.1 porphobilinogen synthase [Helicobacter sp. MIT 14-3879]
MTRLRRLRKNKQIRNLLQENRLDIGDFIYPLFVLEGKNIKNEIKSMEGIYQLSIDNVLKECENLLQNGIYHILLFGIPDYKDSIGGSALNENAIIAKATREIKKNFNEMIISVDLCFCEYTEHGHCGILDEFGNVDNDKTLTILGKQAVILAQSGADIIAPSAMMDNQVQYIRKDLDLANFNDTLIMSYSTKFASAFYGPFRDIADSAPNFGDRKAYQQNPANRFEAIRESIIDESEGADILMVKPALSYLDIVRDVREHTLLPLAVYNVSGEYAMLKSAANNGLIDYERMLLEIMLSFKRAGADIIISYHTKEIQKILCES